MSGVNEPSQREHDIMRDAVVQGTHRMDTSRRRRNQFVAAIVAVVLVGGGVGAVAASALSASRPIVATPTPQTAMPSPTPTPTPTSTPTPTTDPSDPNTWIVTDDGIGPLVLGMPFADAIAAVPGALEACTYDAYSAYRSPDQFLWFTGDAGNDGTALDLVYWKGTDGPRTESGIGVGSTLAEVRAAYPDAHTVEYMDEFLRTGNFTFTMIDGAVAGINVSTKPYVPVEFCG
jgi:hypothetical protein